MKQLLLVLGILLLGSSLHAQVKKESSALEVRFTSQMTWEDVVSIRNDLRKQHIELEYLEIRFNENGRLQYLEIRVDCRDGFSGKAGRSVQMKQAFGFRRDYSKEAGSPFVIGTL